MQTPQLRLMVPNDLTAVMAIQAECYAQLGPESLASYQAKLAASPTTCFVATQNTPDGEKTLGYLISFPWHTSDLPAFNAPTCELPSQPNCFYLHDLAVTPAARKHQLGRLLVEQFFQTAQQLALQQACLVAVEGAHTYWQRFGFQQQAPSPAMSRQLEKYGEQAQFMLATHSLVKAY